MPHSTCCRLVLSFNSGFLVLLVAAAPCRGEYSGGKMSSRSVPDSDGTLSEYFSCAGSTVPSDQDVVFVVPRSVHRLEIPDSEDSDSEDSLVSGHYGKDCTAKYSDLNSLASQHMWSSVDVAQSIAVDEHESIGSSAGNADDEDGLSTSSCESTAESESSQH